MGLRGHHFFSHLKFFISSWMKITCLRKFSAPKKLHHRLTGLQNFPCVGETDLFACMQQLACLCASLVPARVRGVQEAERWIFWAMFPESLCLSLQPCQGSCKFHPQGREWGAAGCVQSSAAIYRAEDRDGSSVPPGKPFPQKVGVLPCNHTVTLFTGCAFYAQSTALVLAINHSQCAAPNLKASLQQ